MSVRLVLVDSNRQFAEKLAAWIHKHMPYHFSIEIMTSSESFRKWAESGGTADLTVISVDIAKEIMDLLPNEGILVLDDGSHERLSRQIPRVDKYRPAEELARDMLSVCADRMPEMLSRGKNWLKITLVLNMDGADSLLPVAPAYAHVFRSMGRKVLYLSLEQVPATSLYFSGTNTRGFNEFLYYIKSDRENLYMRLETCMSTDFTSGIHFISAPPGLISPKSIDSEDIVKLFSVLDRDGDFDEIVVAAEPSMYDILPELMEKAERVLIAVPAAASSALKAEKLFEELRKGNSDITALRNKARLIVVGAGPLNGFAGSLDDIRKFIVEPCPAEPGVSGWVPHQKLVTELAAVLDTFEKAGCQNE